MTDTDLIDERGHTRADAKAHQPQLDLSAPAASQETPTGNTMVAAQTPEEVEAQVRNPLFGEERNPDEDADGVDDEDE